MRIYTVSVDELFKDRDYTFFYPALPNERRKKVDAFLRREDRELCTGAWLVLKRALADAGIDADSVSFSCGSRGKPRLAARPDFHFNLSHSGRMVMCAAGGAPVGCDVEKIAPVSLELAKRYFYRSEFERILAEPAGEARNKMFYRLWTLKESFMKATGLGFSLALDAFEVGFGEEGIFVRQNVSDKGFSFREIERNDGYCYAVCRCEG
ncbi:MAG TPA: 4'-phosphopantetheinyl transferase superfamily protein [Methanocorpusculum sp.]|nr:4'-phosphopantetheinyl transferase superfamily protein [Methanocorpusculum sp.]